MTNKNKVLTHTPPHHPTYRERIGFIVIGIAFVIILLTLARLLTWSLANEDVLEVKNAPTPVRTIRDHPTADGVVILDADFCKKTDAVGRLRLSFVSESREIFLPVTEDKSEKRCERRELPILIPSDLPPGMYKVHFRITYDLNPLKKNILEEFDSKEFEVVAQ